MNFICKLIFGIYVVIGINLTVWGAAFFAARGLTAGCLSAGMLAAVQARPANSVFIVIVQLGNCFTAAIPVLLVAERCLLVIRWGRGMIIRILLAAILIANRTVSGLTTVCFPPGSIVSFCGNCRAVIYNSAAVPANGIAFRRSYMCRRGKNRGYAGLSDRIQYRRYDTVPFRGS